MSIVRSITLALSLIPWAACGASDPPAAGGTQSNAAQEVPAPQVKASAGADAHATCVAVIRRQRDCTDVFIPALVDARVRADMPAGIAGKDKEMGRDALVAAALEEWKVDSTDDAIDATCDKAAGHPELVDRAQACMDETACDAFSACTIEILSAMWGR
ncbi:MAG TPA: hypothetical protein VFU21_21965 [Kofleriaceae bacterium]|nr:hypothetical protein [Kofleriaceae bacterium]